MVKSKKKEITVEKPVIPKENPKITKLKYKLKLFRLKIRNKFRKFKVFISDILDAEDKAMIKNYIIYSLMQGLIVNVALLTFGMKFGFINIISFGSLLWIVEIKLIKFWRRLFFKNPTEPKI